MPMPRGSLRKRDYTPYLVIFVCALSARAVFLIWIDDPILFTKYSYFAQKLAQGSSIGDRIVDLSPFYLYLTTLFHLIAGDQLVLMKWLQTFTGVLICLLLFKLGSQCFNREIGFISALIYAFYGNLIILESTLEPTVFVILFNLLTIYFLLNATEQLKSWRSILGAAATAGFFSGISIITKPSFLLFLPIGFIWLFQKKTNIPGKALKASVLYLTIALLVVMPVTLRNWMQLNDFVLVTADAGKVFFHGNSKGATALEWTGLANEGFQEEGQQEPDYAHVLFRKTASRISGKSLSPSESSSFWFRRTMTDISSDPTGYLVRELKKALFFFIDYEMHFIASAYQEYKASLKWPYIRYGVISALGLTGLFLSMSRFRKLYLLYGIISIYLISGMIFMVQSRYRTPAVPYLSIFAGCTVFYIKSNLNISGLKKATGTAAAVCLLFLGAWFGFRTEILKADRWQIATKIHYQMKAAPFFTQGYYPEAIENLNACLALAPQFGPGYNLRGKAMAIIGRNDDALSDFLKVIALSPDTAQGYRNAGFVHLLKGEKKQALAYLNRSLILAPDDPKAKKAVEELQANDG